MESCTCALPHSCTYRHICTVRQRRRTCKGIECLDGHEGSEFTNGRSRWKGVQVRLWFLGIEYSISQCLMVMCLVCVVIIMDWVESPLVSVYGLICCHYFIHIIFCSVSGNIEFTFIKSRFSYFDRHCLLRQNWCNAWRTHQF